MGLEIWVQGLEFWVQGCSDSSFAFRDVGLGICWGLRFSDLGLGFRDLGLAMCASGLETWV